MRLGMMLDDVAKSMLLRPVTRRYPVEKPVSPARLRGKLHWDPERCTGCALCVKDCPADAISLITLDKKNKRFVMRYHVDRCVFCGQCVESCRFGCLELVSEEWELAAQDTTPFTIYYGDEIDVGTVLAGPAQTDADRPEEK